MSKHSGPDTRFLPRGLEIIYEDRDVIVVDKPPGLLTMGTPGKKSRTAYSALFDHVRKGDPHSRKRVFIVHRLDRETSGILIFAKNEEAKQILQSQWKDTKKKYLAVVHGRMERPAGTVTSYLVENKAFRVYSTKDANIGKLSRTVYRVIGEKGNLTLLEIELLTGRKHQIRVHMADNGHPVVGDRKYGGEHDSNNRMALHALSISFMHPKNGRECFFETKVPGCFGRLLPVKKAE